MLNEQGSICGKCNTYNMCLQFSDALLVARLGWGGWGVGSNETLRGLMGK